MSINLDQVIKIEKPKLYKLHLAQSSGGSQPLDEFVTDFSNWQGWNQYKSKRYEFNRKYYYSIFLYQNFLNMYKL